LKFATLMLAFSALVACNKKTDIWGKLTDAERLAAQQLAQQECLTSTNGMFAEFKTNSTEAVFNNADGEWGRHRSWKHEYKDNTNAVQLTNEIRVWKNTGTEIYLVIKQTTGVITDTYMLRMTPALNDSMIDDLQTQVCNPNDVVASGEDSPISVTEEYSTNDGTVISEYTDTYKFDFTQLALAGTQWKVNRSIILKDQDEVQTGTKSYTSTFVPVTLADLPAVLPSYPKYCDLPDPNPFTLPHVLPPALTAGGCQTTIPVGWDLSI